MLYSYKITLCTTVVLTEVMLKKACLEHCIDRMLLVYLSDKSVQASNKRGYMSLLEGDVMEWGDDISGLVVFEEDAVVLSVDGASLHGAVLA